jgi:competence protein ComEA
MTVLESQRTGIMIAVILCLAVYAFSFLAVGHSSPVDPPIYGVLHGQEVAVEIQGTRGDGIYFLPPGGSSKELLQAVGVIEGEGELFSSSPSIEHGALWTLSSGRGIRTEEMSAARRIALAIPLNINRATLYDLSLIPGIGDGTAARVVQLRTERGKFSSLDELKDVPGIKGKRLDKIRKYLSVEENA